jgi:hypothetical protein
MCLSFSRILLNSYEQDACKCKQSCAISNKSYPLAIARLTKNNAQDSLGGCHVFCINWSTNWLLTKLVVIIINMEYVTIRRFVSSLLLVKITPSIWFLMLSNTIRNGQIYDQTHTKHCTNSSIASLFSTWATYDLLDMMDDWSKWSKLRRLVPTGILFLPTKSQVVKSDNWRWSLWPCYHWTQRAVRFFW